MLGARLRSWMEAQLGRARRRKRKDSPPAPAPPPHRPLHAAVALYTQELCMREIGASLSSPESAYSTGYSTDGTSPSAPPPAPRASRRRAAPPPLTAPPAAPPPAGAVAVARDQPLRKKPPCAHQRSESVGGGPWCRASPPPASPSPRARSRIRTNPWLAAGGSPGARRRRTPTSPRRQRPPDEANLPIARRVSTGSNGESRSSEEEVTLRELLGRYDESYACDRETDILSDAGGAADTDADTGQDGGDEQEPDELDFIDRSPVHSPPRAAPRRAPPAPASQRRRRQRARPHRHPRSAGTTPLSARRNAPAPPVSPARRAAPPPPPRRANSACRAPRRPAHYDSELALLEADREAERKYRELIREAERILVSARSDAPPAADGARSPPHNPRVQLLRAAEADVPRRSSPFVSPRFSPRKNHITNFIQNNSPELCRRESPHRAPLPRPSCDSPLVRAALPPPAPPRCAPSRLPCDYVRLQCLDRPHSEPLKRKFYGSPDDPTLTPGIEHHTSRQQILVETLEGLKKSLEEQSARLLVDGRSNRAQGRRVRLDSL